MPCTHYIRANTSHLNGTKWKIPTKQICPNCLKPIFEWHIRTDDPEMYKQVILDCESGFTDYACQGDS